MGLSSKPGLILAMLAVGLLGCGVSTTANLPAAPAQQTASPLTPSSQIAPAADASLSQEPNTAENTQKTEEKVAAAEPETKKKPSTNPPAKTTSAPPQKPAEKHPKPSAEQIAKWALPDFITLKLLACNDGFEDNVVQSLAMSTDGKKYVLGGFKLTVWNTKDAQPFAELIGALDGEQVKRPVRSVALTPDGKILAAGDQRGKVRLWSMEDQKEIGVINAHEGHITQIVISPDSKMAATTSYSGEVRLWELPGGKKLKSLEISRQELSRLAFLSETLLAATGSEGAWIWNTETGEKVTNLTDKNVIGPALGLSKDRRWLAVNDPESNLKLWDVEKSAWSGLIVPGVSSHLISFSHDGKWIAIYSQDSNIRIIDAEKGRVLQIIPSDGDRIVGIDWIAESHALITASESGKVRIWGNTDAATAIGLTPIVLPELSSTPPGDNRSMTSAQFQNLIDLRSFPRLPDAKPQFDDYGMSGYSAPASQPEAETFYRYLLEKAGWKESPASAESAGGLVFTKEGSQLHVSISPAIPGSRVPDGHIQVSLNFTGNVDARLLPRIAPIDSKSSYRSFSSDSYRTKADLVDLEVGLLKQLHEQGWTPYSRLNAMESEEPARRMFSLLQGGSILNVFIGVPADAKDQFFVQNSIQVSSKSLPIPPDCGWVEFDNSTETIMVATTKRDLNQTVEFYDKQMAAHGWMPREAGRHIKEDKAWLPFIRGQQDALIRLSSFEEGGTRIIVGDIGHSSWQLQQDTKDKSDNKSEAKGIEAADFKLPAGASSVKYDVDQKKIDYTLKGKSPQFTGEGFVKQMESLGWKQDGAGIISDDYVFITFAKDKKEIQLRARGKADEATVMINGDGMLWTKPLPAPPERVSYATWLRRNSKTATLDLIDTFAEEMRKIPAAMAK